MLEASRDHWLGDQIALEALVRFGDEEIKHQELFRRIERMMRDGMADGYRSCREPNESLGGAGQVDVGSAGADLPHRAFRAGSLPREHPTDPDLSPLWKDVFLYHWREESQHALLDELEWMRENAKLTPEERDPARRRPHRAGRRSRRDPAEPVGSGRRLLPADLRTDVPTASKRSASATGVLDAYRWQYIVSGVQGRFGEVLQRFVTPMQHQRIGKALAPIMSH